MNLDYVMRKENVWSLTIHDHNSRLMPPAKSSYSLISLCDRVRSQDAAVAFLQSKKILHSKSQCKKCGTQNEVVSKDKATNYFFFGCSKKGCRSKTSIR